jgi:hypothetical protein
MCWPNTTADNSVPEDWTKPAETYVQRGQQLSLAETSHGLSSVNSGKNCPRITCMYFSQLIA